MIFDGTMGASSFASDTAMAAMCPPAPKLAASSGMLSERVIMSRPPTLSTSPYAGPVLFWKRQYLIHSPFLDPCRLSLRSLFIRFSRLRALVAAQVYGTHTIKIFAPGLDVRIAEGRRLHHFRRDLHRRHAL